MSQPGRTAAIVGGSLTGLITARLLTRAGWDVHVFERVPENLSGRGAGIGTHAEFFAVLEAAGIPTPDDIGVTVTMRRLFDRDGRVALELHYPQIVTHWDRVYSLLRENVPDSRYHLGKHLAGFTQTRDGVSLEFGDGERLDADLLVGADGIRSTTRSILFPDIHPQYVSYVAWRTVVPERLLSAGTHRDIFSTFNICLPPGEQMAGYPIQRVDAEGSHRELNVIWYRPLDSKGLTDLLTDESGRVHEMNIPPPLIKPTLKAQVKADAARTLAPQFAEAIRVTDNLFCQPIYDVEVPAMAFGRVALVGDAAFVARPHVGAGVTKAFSDAGALVKALDREPSVPAALAAYERERLPVGRVILQRARQLGAYMQASKKTEAERRFAEAHRDPAAVLRETASLDFPEYEQVIAGATAPETNRRAVS